MPARFFHHDPSMNLIPIVIEQTGRGERSYDIYSRLLKVGLSKWETHIGQQLLILGICIKKKPSRSLDFRLIFLRSSFTGQNSNRKFNWGVPYHILRSLLLRPQSIFDWEQLKKMWQKNTFFFSRNHVESTCICRSSWTSKQDIKVKPRKLNHCIIWKRRGKIRVGFERNKENPSVADPGFWFLSIPDP